MKRTPEEKRKELGQAWHFLDPYPWPSDLAAHWSHWVFQGALPRDTDQRVKIVQAAITFFGYDSEIKLTRQILKLIREEAEELEKIGKGEGAAALRAVMDKIVEGRLVEKT